MKWKVKAASAKGASANLGERGWSRAERRDQLVPGPREEKQWKKWV